MVNARTLLYSCPICGKSEQARYIDPKQELKCECTYCGPFFITGAAIKELNHKSDDVVKMKSALFYFLRTSNRKDTPPVFYTNQEESTYSQNSDARNLNTIISLYPRSFSDRIDKVMQVLNTIIINIGDSFGYKKDSYEYRSFGIHKYFFLPSSDNSDESDETLRLLIDLKYLKELSSTTDSFSFDSQGWEKIDSLQRQTKSQTAFIAMSFDAALSQAECTIKDAITDAGYIPMIIKDKAHNNSIVEEITYEIKQAAFVITDLTKQNNGAYYEAGLAKGFGKDVIFTCCENDFDNIHFDTKQINTIKWSDTDMDKFKNDLFNRIKFTIGVYSE